jgi:hypothetical protein
MRKATRRMIKKMRRKKFINLYLARQTTDGHWSGCGNWSTRKKERNRGWEKDRSRIRNIRGKRRKKTEMRGKN